MLIFLQVRASVDDRLLRRSQPYRNKRIINMIQSTYFTGGVPLFARRFDHLFSRHCDSQGAMKTEVLYTMVALIATAVRFFISYASTSMPTYNVCRCTRPCLTSEMVKRNLLISQPVDTVMSMMAMSICSRTCGLNIQVNTTL